MCGEFKPRSGPEGAGLPGAATERLSSGAAKARRGLAMCGLCHVLLPGESPCHGRRPPSRCPPEPEAVEEEVAVAACEAARAAESAPAKTITAFAYFEQGETVRTQALDGNWPPSSVNPTGNPRPASSVRWGPGLRP